MSAINAYIMTYFCQRFEYIEWKKVKKKIIAIMILKKSFSHQLLLDSPLRHFYLQRFHLRRFYLHRSRWDSPMYDIL